jgi:hypothetical protein
MGEISQSYQERIGPQFVPAVLNPEVSSFNSFVRSSSYKIFDIGCGHPPRLSWGVKEHQLWVGCDQAITQSGEDIKVHSIFPYPIKGKLVVCSDIAAEVPPFEPDVISLIAPNPKDIYEGNILNFELENFLSKNKTQYLTLVLDNRTYEAMEYGKSAKEEIAKWMNEFHFKKMGGRPIFPCNFMPNSADLGIRNTLFFGIRNPQK